MNKRFAELVLRAFAFLEQSHFRPILTEPSLVTYEGERSYICVVWDMRSGELNVFVGVMPRTNLAQDAYSLQEILGVEGFSTSERKPAEVADERRLEPYIATLAEQVRTFGQLAISGDSKFFHKLEEFRAAQAEENMHAMRLRQVRADVEKAWRNGLFQEVVRLYTSVENELSDVEAHKLKYARQRVIQ